MNFLSNPGIIVFMALVMLAICCQIGRLGVFIKSTWAKEINERGHFVHGKVEKIRERRVIRRLESLYDCAPVVSFTWENIEYRQRTLMAVPYRKYTEGSDVELLFLPETQKVIIKDEEHSSSSALLADTVSLVAMVIAVVALIISVK